MALGASYTYDARDRVETFTPDDFTQRTYEYDELGNLTKRPRFDGGVQNHDFDTPGAPYQLTAIDPPGPQPLVTLAYDADGNRTHDPSRGRDYTYDADGRLTKVGTSEDGDQIARHRYDVDGRRISSVLSNLRRVFGSRREHLSAIPLKVDVVVRHLESLGLGLEVIALPLKVQSKEATRANPTRTPARSRERNLNEPPIGPDRR